MIRCLAIDDEPLALKQLVSYIEKVPFLELVASCNSAREARKYLENDTVDAMFLDINMPDLSGMELVKSLAAPPLVVFVTAYSEFAVEGYKVDAVDYLLKPFSLDDFRRAANKVRAMHELRSAGNTPADVTVSDGDKALFFKTDYRIIRVDLSKIRYVEGMGEYLKIYVEGEELPAVVLLSMKKLQEELPADSFMRVHRSYLINLRKISEVTKGHVLMEGKVSIPIGDIYRDEFFNYLNSKFLGR